MPCVWFGLYYYIKVTLQVHGISYQVKSLKVPSAKWGGGVTPFRKIYIIIK